MDYPELQIESISKRIGKGKGFIKPAANVKTNSYYKAKPINEKFPLILFSHGLGGYKSQNLINIEIYMFSEVFRYNLIVKFMCT